MEKNQINNLIESLRNVQQLRQESVDKDKMRLRDIRVVNEGRQFYATVTVTQNFILIVPNDSDILATYLENRHSRGFNDGTKSIELILMCNRSRYTLHFRTEEQTKRVLNRLKMFAGAETTSDSSESR